MKSKYLVIAFFWCFFLSILGHAQTPRPIAATAVYNGAGFLYIPTSTPFGNRACYFDNNSVIQSSSVTSTELGYLSGATSNLQAQIDSVTTGAVTSVFSRTGDVVGASGDYSSFYPLRANNLSDLASASTARTNLGLGTAATQASSAFDAAGAAATAQAAAIAASDASGSAAAVLASSLQKSSNLSDLTSASTARTNLGLGTAAVKALAFFLQAASNLSDVPDTAAARTNLGLGSAATQSSSAFDASGSAATVSAASLQKSSNLSDLVSAATARGNLGLGSAAVKNTNFFDLSGAAAAAQAAAQAASDPVGSAAAVLASSLQITNNLSDLGSASTARTNLGLGTASTQASSAFDSSGAAAAVLSSSLQKASNLSDLASASAARTHLGLGTAATQATSAFDAAGAAAAAQAAAEAASDSLGSAATVQAASLQKTSNLSDLTSPSSARGNLGLGTSATHNVADFQAPLTWTGSLDDTADVVQLVNDAVNPGAFQFYGTDGFGLKGWYPVPAGGSGGSGSGTVTSVAQTVPAWLSIAGSPVTTFGTLAITAKTGQAANKVLATPNGATGAVSLRSLVAADIPTLNQNTTGNAATATAFAAAPSGCTGTEFVTGIDASGNASCATPAGGSGGGSVTSVAQTVPAWLSIAGSPVTTSGTLAITAKTGQSANLFLATPNGATGAVSLRAIVAADIPTLNQNTTGNAATATQATSLAGSPTQCISGQFSTGVDANGDANCADGSGGGTVTSVALSTPAYFTVTGSPITASGTLAIAGTTGLAANEVLATPNGATGALAVRALVAADIPTLNQNTTGNAATATALATAPSGCTAGSFVTGIAANGNASCAVGGTGSVTTVSVVSTNGFAGTVANASTTPAITIKTTVTGLLLGNGTQVSAATPGTDYQVPLTFADSLTDTSNTVTLVNDASSPSGNYYYGTNSGGTKGWYAITSAISGGLNNTVVTSTGSITMTANSQLGAMVTVAGTTQTLSDCTSTGPWTVHISNFNNGATNIARGGSNTFTTGSQSGLTSFQLTSPGANAWVECTTGSVIYVTQ